MSLAAIRVSRHKHWNYKEIDDDAPKPCYVNSKTTITENFNNAILQGQRRPNAKSAANDVKFQDFLQSCLITGGSQEY